MPLRKKHPLTPLHNPNSQSQPGGEGEAAVADPPAAGDVLPRLPGRAVPARALHPRGRLLVRRAAVRHGGCRVLPT